MYTQQNPVTYYLLPCTNVMPLRFDLLVPLYETESSVSLLHQEDVQILLNSGERKERFNKNLVIYHRECQEYALRPQQCLPLILHLLQFDQYKTSYVFMTSQ